MNLARLLSFLVVLTAAASIAEAQNPRGRSARTKSLPKRAAAADRNSKGSLSEEECRAFAEELAKAVSSGNRAAVNALIDWDSMLVTALEGLALPDAQRAELTKGIKIGLEKETGIAGQLVKNGQGGGKFDYLRTRKNQGRQVILMRMIQPMGTGGVGYFEFVPKRSAAGQTRAVDVYVYSSAEFVSASLRRAVLPIVANLSRTFLDKLLTSERDYIRDLPKLPGILALVNEGKNPEALAQLKTLGADTQKEKMILLIRVRAAQSIDDKEYTAVLEDFRKLYPNDPCIDLLSIDYYTLKKDFPQALASVDRLDKAVGGDPYLNMIRAGVSQVQNDLPTALKFAKRAVDEEPTLLDAHFAVIGISMKAEKFDETLAALKKQDQSFQMNYNDFKTVPEYAGFVKSPQYPQWLQYLAEKGNPQKAAPAKSPAKTKKTRSGRAKAASGT